MCFLARFIIWDVLLLPTALLFIFESGNLNCEAIKKDASNHWDFCTLEAAAPVTVEEVY